MPDQPNPWLDRPGLFLAVERVNDSECRRAELRERAEALREGLEQVERDLADEDAEWREARRDLARWRARARRGELPSPVDSTLRPALGCPVSIVRHDVNGAESLYRWHGPPVANLTPAAWADLRRLAAEGVLPWRLRGSLSWDGRFVEVTPSVACEGLG